MLYELQKSQFYKWLLYSSTFLSFIFSLKLLKVHSFIDLINIYWILTVFQEFRVAKKSDGGEDYISISVGVGL